MPFFDLFRAKEQSALEEIQLVSRSLLGLEHLVFEDSQPNVLEVGDNVKVYRYKVVGNGVTALALTVWDHASTGVVTLLILNLEASYQINNLVMVLGHLARYGIHVVDKADVYTLLEYVSGNRLLGIQAFALVTMPYEPARRVGDVLLFLQGLGTGRQDSVRMLAFMARAALDSLVNDYKFLDSGGTAIYHSRRSTDLFVNGVPIGDDDEDIPMVVDIRGANRSSKLNPTGSHLPADTTVKF
jgi:hypothetical protein